MCIVTACLFVDDAINLKINLSFLILITRKAFKMTWKVFFSSFFKELSVARCSLRSGSGP